MDYRNLGSSSLKISRLGLGAMGIGDPSWREWVLDEVASRPIVKRSLDLGINFIDTCDFYSRGRSEEIVGRLIKELVPRDEIVLATKAGNPMGKGPNARGYSRKHLFEAVEQSLRRLATDYIDLYQTHIWDVTTNLEEMVDAFDDLVRSGKVLYLGITDMPAWQLAKAYYDQRHRGLARFVSVQNHYNPIWREDERELIPLCRTEGVGLIPYSPMARGYLCGRQRRNSAEMTTRARTDDYGQKLYGRSSDEKVADAVERVAQAHGVLPAQVALAWTLSRPGVTAPIFGATKTEHVDAAVAALELKLEPTEIQAIDSAYEPRAAGGH
ncbi:MAG TPA: aldo/keto reductase [Stellaceae bacterium]|nr:aldo/keto reductase [Stellaceae bacterium]